MVSVKCQGNKKAGMLTHTGFHVGDCCSPPRVDSVGGTGEISFYGVYGLFGHYLEGDFYEDFLVEVYFGGVLANLFHGLFQLDELAGKI